MSGTDTRYTEVKQGSDYRRLEKVLHFDSFPICLLSPYEVSDCLLLGYKGGLDRGWTSSSSWTLRELS